jgi:hypothetical protein
MPSSSAGSRRDNIATHLHLNLYPSCMCIDDICRHPLYILKVQLRNLLSRSLFQSLKSINIKKQDANAYWLSYVLFEVQM